MSSFLKNAWDTGIGPDIEAGASAVWDGANATAGWLSDRFNEMDPGGQQWLQAIGTFGAVHLGMSWFMRLTGVDNFFVGAILKFVLPGVAAIAVSGGEMPEDNRMPGGPQAENTATEEEAATLTDGGTSQAFATAASGQTVAPATEPGAVPPTPAGQDPVRTAALNHSGGGMGL